jgi:hypothetical protein
MSGAGGCTGASSRGGVAPPGSGGGVGGLVSVFRARWSDAAREGGGGASPAEGVGGSCAKEGGGEGGGSAAERSGGGTLPTASGLNTTNSLPPACDGKGSWSSWLSSSWSRRGPCGTDFPRRIKYMAPTTPAVATTTTAAAMPTLAPASNGAAPVPPEVSAPLPPPPPAAALEGESAARLRVAGAEAEAVGVADGLRDVLPLPLELLLAEGVRDVEDERVLVGEEVLEREVGALRVGEGVLACVRAGVCVPAPPAEADGEGEGSALREREAEPDGEGVEVVEEECVTDALSMLEGGRDGEGAGEALALGLREALAQPDTEG